MTRRTAQSHDNEDDQDALHSRSIGRRVDLLEEIRSNDVAHCRCSIVGGEVS